jgi:formylmethanofuran--tetrahydromethanopterin N-formyltransferase
MRLNIGPTKIKESFAEAFGMRFTRLVITAHDDHWLQAAVREATGFATSVIACDVEAALERWLSPAETPDGRPGGAILMFGFATASLADSVTRRVGQCILTCPTTAVYDGLPDGAERVPLGKFLRFFGDGFQKSKVIGDRRFWRVPVMDGEFLVEETAGVAKGIAGGNIILQCTDSEVALRAARRVVDSLATIPGVIVPFPGGVVRSGSKVGSKYKKLRASTNNAYCPTLAGRVPTELHPEANCAYEVVIDGVDEPSVGKAMAMAARAASGDGILVIEAGNYGGKLGKFHFHLTEVLDRFPG